MSLTREQRAAVRQGFKEAESGREGQPSAVRAPVPSGPTKVQAKKTRLIVYDAELGEALSQALTTVNATRKEIGEKPLDWNTFVVYGLLKSGLAAFEAARAEYDRSQRLVLTADEARMTAGRR